MEILSIGSYSDLNIFVRYSIKLYAEWRELDFGFGLVGEFWVFFIWRMKILFLF